MMLTSVLSTSCNENAQRYGLNEGETEHYKNNMEVKKGQLERILQEVMEHNPDLLTNVSSVPLVLNQNKTLNGRDVLVVVIK